MDFLKALPEEDREEIENKVKASIEKFALVLKACRETIEEAQGKIKNLALREKLVRLVEFVAPEEKEVRTQRVKVQVVPQPPRKEVGPSGFINLLESLSSDKKLTSTVLIGCIRINYNEAKKLLETFFSPASVKKLDKITTETPRDPHVLVEVLAGKEGQCDNKRA